jgi:hypothetical protein
MWWTRRVLLPGIKANGICLLGSEEPNCIEIDVVPILFGRCAGFVCFDVALLIAFWGIVGSSCSQYYVENGSILLTNVPLIIYVQPLQFEGRLCGDFARQRELQQN